MKKDGSKLFHQKDLKFWKNNSCFNQKTLHNLQFVNVRTKFRAKTLRC